MKRLLKWLNSFIPRQLPTGVTSFNAWLDDVVYISGLPNNASVRQLAATFIMHTPPNVTYLSIRHISDQLCKAAAYQVAQAILKGQTTADLKVVPNDTQATTETPR